MRDHCRCKGPRHSPLAPSPHPPLTHSPLTLTLPLLSPHPPLTLRPLTLRRLYHSKLARVYLFIDCQRKFLDVILAYAKIETFMPKVWNA